METKKNKLWIIEYDKYIKHLDFNPPDVAIVCAPTLEEAIEILIKDEDVSRDRIEGHTELKLEPGEIYRLEV